jgi:hypothetical protein
MNPDRLITLLAANAADVPPGSAACPDEHQIAGYVDGGLDPASRELVELHLADCGHCLALVGLLSRERNDDPVASTPAAVSAPPSLPAKKQSPSRWRFAPQWAAAAAIVLAVPLLLQLSRTGGPDAVQERATTRTLAPMAGEIQVLSPRAGAATVSSELSFRWTEVAGSPFYDVRIVTDAGDLVIQERVTGTSWRPPRQLKLQPGAEYFVHVDAYPAGDKAVSTDHVPFRISD